VSSYAKQKTKRFWDLESGLVGQNINIAIDTYRVTDGRIAENWHIEDNVTLPAATRKNRQLR